MPIVVARFAGAYAGSASQWDSATHGFPPMDYLHKADARGSAFGSDSMLVQFGGRRMATTPIPERSGQSSAGKCGIGQVDI